MTGGAPLTDLLAVFPAFSYPQDMYLDQLNYAVPFIIREYAAALTSQFLAHNYKSIDAQTGNLIQCLASWAAQPHVANQTLPTGPYSPIGWDSSFGDAFKKISVPGPEQVEVASAIGTHLGSCRVSMEWNAAFSRPAQLRWGNWQIPPTDHLSVQSDGSNAVIQYTGATGAKKIELSHSNGEWRSINAEHLCHLAYGDIHATFLTRDVMPIVRRIDDHDDLYDRTAHSIAPAIVATFAETFEILKAYAPDYLPWIARTIHQILVVTPREANFMESGSTGDFLGLIWMSSNCKPLALAELLLHEATHQYMNLLSKVEPLEDGSDSKLYWSPPVNKARPLSMIITAVHAFANVMLFYRMCHERGLENEQECERQEELLSTWLRELVPPLIENPALTPAGNALVFPILSALGK